MAGSDFLESSASTNNALNWGRTYLMCPPDHFGVFYEINPWMHTQVAPDRDLAHQTMGQSRCQYQAGRWNCSDDGTRTGITRSRFYR